MLRISTAVVGAGVVGSTIAAELARAGQEVVVYEAQPRDRLENQSTRNSGVIHAGVFYDPKLRPNKARLCVRGNQLLYRYCEEHEIAHQRCGKLVVASAVSEDSALAHVADIAARCGVEVRELSASEVRNREPGVCARRALWIPSSGIIDAAAYLRSQHRAVRACGAEILFATRVVDIKTIDEGFVLRTECQGREEEVLASTLINCAGLYADEIAKHINAKHERPIVPVCGESALFYARADMHWKGHNVYPVPQAFAIADGTPVSFASKGYHQRLLRGEIVETTGVHLSPTLDDSGQIATTVTVGPRNLPACSKEDFAGGSQAALHDIFQRVSRFFPDLRADDLGPHQVGIQAKRPGELDWKIEHSPRLVQLIGIDSPGLTASLAIAEEVARLFRG